MLRSQGRAFLRAAFLRFLAARRRHAIPKRAKISLDDIIYIAYGQIVAMPSCQMILLLRRAEEGEIQATRAYARRVASQRRCYRRIGQRPAEYMATWLFSLCRHAKVDMPKKRRQIRTIIVMTCFLHWLTSRHDEPLPPHGNGR